MAPAVLIHSLVMSRSTSPSTLTKLNLLLLLVDISVVNESSCSALGTGIFQSEVVYFTNLTCADTTSWLGLGLDAGIFQSEVVYSTNCTPTDTLAHDNIF